MENTKKITGIECKFSMWLPKIVDNYTGEITRKDTHVVKERIHYSDGTNEPNLRIIEDFKRPFWTTKEHFQNHKEKKETEHVDRLNRHLSSESDLGRNIAIQLGKRYTGKTTIRDVRDSPYIYGIDINSKTFLKNTYRTKYPDAISDNSYASLDIEADVDEDELTIISIAMKDKIFGVMTKKYIESVHEPLKQLNYYFDKYIPKHNLLNGIAREFIIVDTELDAVKAVMKKAHEWKPDIIGIWNITYDIQFMINICNKFGVDPKDIFSDPNIPENLRYFEFKKGPDKKVTESGVTKVINFEEQWHTVLCPASFYFVDAACVHRYVRVGGKTIAGGYSLSNILTQELGKEFDKLKFKDDIPLSIDGIDWHRYMSKNKKLEYFIYNNWDILSMLVLDDFTTDISKTISILSGNSGFDIFDSGPKKLVDGMFFYFLENGFVLGSKPVRVSDDKLLGLQAWICKDDNVLMFNLLGFDRYMLTSNFEIYSKDRKKLMNWFITKPPSNNVKNVTGGYRVITLTNNSGNRIVVRRHRLLLEVFKPVKNSKELVVNHINGIPGDDRLQNLEWVTRKDNLIHAIKNGLMPNSVIKIDMKDLTTGEIKTFDSASICARYLKVSNSKVVKRMYNNTFYYADKLIFKKHTDEWPINLTYVEMGIRRKVEATLPNGTVENYNNIMSASDGTGVNTTSISVACKKHPHKPVKGIYFKFTD